MTRYTLPILFIVILAACQSKSTKTVSSITPAKKDTVKTLTKLPSKAEDITGTYYAESIDGQSESCNMSVLIKKGPKAYIYEFTINGEKIKGKATVKENDNKETYINFEGIKWAEYEGDISQDPEKGDTTSLELPVGIDGLLAGKEITIQNYGNSMNYYVKFAGCDEKYIRLVKQTR
jgi:hypothetical protein